MHMNSIEQKFKALEELMLDLADMQDRLEFFVDQSRSNATLPSKYLIESFRVSGCISNLWIVPRYSEGLCHFMVDGDAVIPKGVAVTILDLFQGATPLDIASFDKDRLRTLGVAEVLSPNRRNALSHVFDEVYRFAVSIIASEQPQAISA